jgi:hypothetical protein
LYSHEKQSQEKQILKYLESGKKITAIQALDKFNCWRLSARIADLRREGHPIETEIIHTPTQKYIARYYYAKS